MKNLRRVLTELTELTELHGELQRKEEILTIIIIDY